MIFVTKNIFVLSGGYFFHADFSLVPPFFFYVGTVLYFGLLPNLFRRRQHKRQEGEGVSPLLQERKFLGGKISPTFHFPKKEMALGSYFGLRRGRPVRGVLVPKVPKVTIFLHKFRTYQQNVKKFFLELKRLFGIFYKRKIAQKTYSMILSPIFLIRRMAYFCSSQ